MSPDRLAAFAKLVREKRLAFGTRSAFCEYVGITRTTLRALEGAAQQPSQDTIDKLVEKLGMTPEELVGGQRIKPDHPLLKDLTEDDLRVAQMFHHAGLTVKQHTIGVLQARQQPHDRRLQLSADVTDVAEQLLSLDAPARYTVSQLIAALTNLIKATPPAPLPVPAPPPKAVPNVARKAKKVHKA
jgi:transcriptional regulator with XRE-family HTH domain